MPDINPIQGQYTDYLSNRTHKRKLLILKIYSLCPTHNSNFLIPNPFCFPHSHGEPWREFRSRVQKPVLQLSTVRRYVTPLEQVTEEFIDRCNQMLDHNKELPDDFDNEIHKWSLECIGLVALDTRLGCLEPNLSDNSEPQQIINAAKYALRNVATLELKAPYWRYFPTPLWSKYVNNMDYFVKYEGVLRGKLRFETLTVDFLILGFA